MDHKLPYQEGRSAARAYYSSQGYASYTRFVKAEDAMKLFLPPVTEHLSQVSSPLPKSRQAWINGFSAEQEIITRRNHERQGS